MSEAVDKKFVGTVEFENSELVVRFNYSKRRYSDIRRISEARFDKATKSWRLPVTTLARLERLRSFDSKFVDYRFDKDQVQALSQTMSEQKEQALSRVVSNPFSVPLGLIKEAQVPVVFFKNDQQAGVRIEVNKDERARKTLLSAPGVTYSKKNKNYIIPVESIKKCLRVLRDARIAFAVEKSLGDQLSATASLRSEIACGNFQPSLRELKSCLMMPQIDYVQSDNSEPLFSLHAFSSEQLNLLLSFIKPPHLRIKKAKDLTLEEFKTVMDIARINDFKLWPTAKAQQCIDQYATDYSKCFDAAGKAFDDRLLAFVIPDHCWTVDADGKALLLVSIEKLNHDQYSFLPEIMSVASKVHLAWCKTHVAYRVPDYKLHPVHEEAAKAFKEIEVYVPFSQKFLELYDEVLSRWELIKQQNYFHNLADCKLENLPEEMESRLFPHQRVAVKWLGQTDYGLLGDDMGLGKTLSILTTFYQRYIANELEKFLVICPQSLVSNWVKEASQWFPQLKVEALDKDKRGQQSMLEAFGNDELFNGLIINFETFRLERICSVLADIMSQKPVMLIVDESQRVKNPTSKSFKALSLVSQHARMRYLLSGTPTPRDLADIWSQVFLLDSGIRLGTNYFDWLSKVAQLGNDYSEYAVVKFYPEAIQETIARVREILLRRRKEAVIDLPEKIFSCRELVMKGEQKKRYKEITSELLLRVSNIQGDTDFKEINNVLEEYLRAVQVASNPRLIDPLWKGDPIKFIELDSIVEEVIYGQEGKIVIWTNYLNNVEEIQERYSKFGVVSLTGKVPAVERAKAIADFQSETGESPKVFVAIPAAGGVGITLTAAQTVVYLDKTWNAEHFLQSVDRVHRIGQKGVVNIISLHASAIDRLIAKNLKKKEDNQKKLLGDSNCDFEDILPGKQELLEALSD